MSDCEPKYKVCEKVYHIERLHYKISEGIVKKNKALDNGIFYQIKGKGLYGYYHESFVSNDITELLKRYIKELSKQVAYHRQMMLIFNEDIDKLVEILAKYEPDIYLKGIK